MKPNLHGVNPLGHQYTVSNKRVWNAAIEQFLSRMSQMDWQTEKISWRHILDAGDKMKFTVPPVSTAIRTKVMNSGRVDYWQQEDNTWSAQMTHHSGLVGPIVGKYTTANGAMNGAMNCLISVMKYADDVPLAHCGVDTQFKKRKEDGTDSTRIHIPVPKRTE